MGNSTIKLKTVFDVLAAKGIPDPRGGSSGFGDTLALDIATRVMADLVCERFNWKWNSAVAVPFYTNSWQQDYPQPVQPQGMIGWGENCVAINVNSTVVPKPLCYPSWRKQLNLSNVAQGGIALWNIGAVCWMYNKDLTKGVWPGAGVTYYPLVTTGPQQQNPLMAILDANGNILIVTTFGTTGSSAPILPVNSAEGVTVTDGSVIWTCVSPTSQGFRIDSVPSSTSPSMQMTPTFQIEPVQFAGFSQLLDPIPDSYKRYFQRGVEAECLIASPNPGDMQRGNLMRMEWMKALEDAMKQGDREQNAFKLRPTTSPVQSAYGYWGGPRTADRPY